MGNADPGEELRMLEAGERVAMAMAESLRREAMESGPQKTNLQEAQRTDKEREEREDLMLLFLSLGEGTERF